MSVTLFLLLGGGAAATGWVAGRLVRRQAASSAPALPSSRAAIGELFLMPRRRGDVLVRAPDDEALLTSALTFREGDEVVARLWSAPRKGQPDRLVVELPPPARDLLWLSPVTLPSYREPPSSLPVEPALPLSSRRAVTIERDGEGAPASGATGVLALYRDARGRAGLCLCSAEHPSLTASGDTVASDRLDVLPGGD